MRNAIHKYLEHADMQNIDAIDETCRNNEYFSIKLYFIERETTLTATSVNRVNRYRWLTSSATVM